MISILTFCRGQGCLLLQGVSLLCRYPTTQRQTHSHAPTHTQTHTNTQTDTHSYSFTYIVQVLQSTAQVMHVCGNKFEAKSKIDLFAPRWTFLNSSTRPEENTWCGCSFFSFSPNITSFLIIPIVVRPYHVVPKTIQTLKIYLINLFWTRIRRSY